MTLDKENAIVSVFHLGLENEGRLGGDLHEIVKMISFCIFVFSMTILYIQTNWCLYDYILSFVRASGVRIRENNHDILKSALTFTQFTLYHSHRNDTFLRKVLDFSTASAFSPPKGWRDGKGSD